MSTALLFRLVLALSPLWLSACAPLTFTIGGDPADNRLRTRTIASEGGMFNPRVAIIDVSGLMHHGRSPGLLSRGENPVGLLHEQLVQAAADRHVKAVVLRLNTPGGTVTASDAMYREVQLFRQHTGKPVIALMMDVAASGGYYVACAADEIVAYPTAITGSIGVVVQTLSVRDGLNRIGVRTEAITSGPNKDIASPLGTLTPEHRLILRGLVDDFHAQFVTVVRSARPGIAPEQFETATDGRIFSGGQAVDIGLVDRTGDLYHAVARAKQAAGIERADLVVYHRPFDWAGSPYAAAPGRPPYAGTQINLAQINLGETLLDGGAGFYYLWQPELSGGAEGEAATPAWGW